MVIGLIPLIVAIGALVVGSVLGYFARQSIAKRQANTAESRIEKLVNEINYFGISNIVLRDIFDNIIKKTELYNIIKEWFSNKYKYSSELISSMIMLSSKYDGKIKDITNKMNEQKNRLNTEALNKLNYESKFYTLLKSIVDKLMINERSKNQRNQR